MSEITIIEIALSVHILMQNVGLSFGNVVLYNNTQLSSSGFIFHKYSDIITPDISTIAVKYDIRTYSQSSLIECGIFCKLESRCNYFHLEETDRTCTLLDLSRTDKRLNGIYDCPLYFALYQYGDLKLCLSVIQHMLNRDTGASWCSARHGNLAILIDDDKHALGEAIGLSTYLTTSKTIWIDAKMNIADSKYYWSNGTQVDETKFDQTSQSFITRDRSKPCVAFLSNKYYPFEFDATKMTLCEADMYKI